MNNITYCSFIKHTCIAAENYVVDVHLYSFRRENILGGKQNLPEYYSLVPIDRFSWQISHYELLKLGNH